MDNLEIKRIFFESKSWRYAKKPLEKYLGSKPNKQEIYDIVYDIVEEDRVADCGKAKKFRDFSFGYEFCGRNCQCSVALGRGKAKITMVERYGVVYAMHNTEIADRIRVTNQERYGVDYPLQNAEIKQKIKDTNMERLGVDSPVKSESVRKKIEGTNELRYGARYPLMAAEIRQKIITTNMDRYGSESPLVSSDVRKKCTDTTLERYGVENISHLPQIREKARGTTFERYGVEYAMQSSEIRERAKATNKERYGVECASRQYLPPESIEILDNREKLENFLIDKSLIKASKELGISYSGLLRTTQRHGLYKVSRSSFENEIASFLRGLDIPFEQNVRKPLHNKYELDFYLPDYSIGIEFNGLYWHSSDMVDNSYHRSKYLACQHAGIRLLMISEDEWLEHETAWRDRISNILKMSQRGKPARKLSLRPINQKEANHFFNMHHIQGETRAICFALGAYDEDVQVGVMAFNKQRLTKKIELVRFCTDGKSYAGLFSKMLNRAVALQSYEEILSFADLRHSLGAVYHKNGFDLAGEIRPDYRYVYKSRTYHKSSFTKKHIGNKFGLDMDNMTERQAMELLKIPRMYDCGKLKFIWRKKRTSNTSTNLRMG